MSKQQHGWWRRRASDVFWVVLAITLVTLWTQRDMLEADTQAQQQQLPRLSGGSEPLLIEGQRTLVYFFAPWCSICKLSIGNLDSVSDQVRTIAVALDYQNVAAVAEFIAEVELESPVLLGNRALREAYQIKGYPSYYVIDEFGKVEARSAGYSSLAGLLWRSKE